ncbi:MAG: hypothetical protein ACYDGW_12150 [Vulcanimicrobiaceae bacterium]
MTSLGSYKPGEVLSDSQLIEIANYFEAGNYEIKDIARLAEILAYSGDHLDRCDVEPAFDVASTGGPSSLTTLLCPLMLAECGYNVPKLTVRGRPAGGIDVLQTIPGYRAKLDSVEMRRILQECGYAHTLAAGVWAPLDGRLFMLRQSIGMQSVPPLVVASIISKKLAVGLQRAAIEIRAAPHGNFGSEYPEALSNSELFRAVGATLGIDIRCAITDNTAPYQPYIGRGEALMALDMIFQGNSGLWLDEHVSFCRDLVAWSTENIACSAFDLSSLKVRFYANIETQGASIAQFESHIRKLHSIPRTEVVAFTEGTLIWDLGSLRDAIIMFQGRDGTDDDAGVVVLRRSGEWVEAGQPIATARTGGDLQEFCRIIQATASISGTNEYKRREVIFG